MEVPLPVERCHCCASCILSAACRSPSPEPIYNSEGKRLNTREYRTRKKIEEERHSLITEMIALNPDFKPPADYKYVNPLTPPPLLGAGVQRS